jgi:hypothetical protein
MLLLFLDPGNWSDGRRPGAVHLTLRPAVLLALSAYVMPAIALFRDEVFQIIDGHMDFEGDLRERR